MSTPGCPGRGINTWVIVTTLVGNSVTLGLGTLQWGAIVVASPFVLMLLATCASAS